MRAVAESMQAGARRRVHTHVVLLTNGIVAPLLGGLLKSVRRDLDVVHVPTLKALNALRPRLLRNARLIGFATPVVVPPAVLDALGFGAYNFHPGPPSYPGWAPGRRALRDGATEFGATAHAMREQVDAGPIVGTEMFPVRCGITATELDDETWIAMARLFRRLAFLLAAQPAALPELASAWRAEKRTPGDLVAANDMPAHVASEALLRRIDALNHAFRLPPAAAA